MPWWLGGSGLWRTATAVLLVAAVPAAAQEITTPAALIARGWAALAQGDAARASSIGASALAGAPKSAAALSLAVAAEVARAGAHAGLATYEDWLGARTTDDGYQLRVVARAVLSEASTTAQADPRIEALRDLAADGDEAAAATLKREAYAGGSAETRALAQTGDLGAINILIAQLSGPDEQLDTIDALVKSGSPLAVAPLERLLSSATPQYRAAAADGLGRLGASGAVARLAPLLADKTYFVAFAAAGALYRLGDMRGESLLTDAAGSTVAASRLAAAEALAARPDAAWQALVHGLTSDDHPSVRLAAARLLAPSDPATARALLERLLGDPTATIREAAARILADDLPTDFATLRQLLHSGDVLSDVFAANRILELTR